jgi:hypothetical protein
MIVFKITFRSQGSDKLLSISIAHQVDIDNNTEAIYHNSKCIPKSSYIEIIMQKEVII